MEKSFQEPDRHLFDGVEIKEESKHDEDSDKGPTVYDEIKMEFHHLVDGRPELGTFVNPVLYRFNNSFSLTASRGLNFAKPVPPQNGLQASEKIIRNEASNEK